MTVELGLDMGSSFTTLFKKGEGVVLREPTLVAVSADSRRDVVAVGSAAARLYGKTSSAIEVESPVRCGKLVAPLSAAKMLETFFAKVRPKTFFKPYIKVIACVPACTDSEGREAYASCIYEAGASEVLLVEAPYATVCGLELRPSGQPIMLVDVGGGKSDVSVISSAGLIKACTLPLGGSLLDESIVEFLEDYEGVTVSLSAAERVKREIASLYASDTLHTYLSETDREHPVMVDSTMILELAEGHYMKIAEVAKDVLRSLSPEAAGAVRMRGVYLLGGGGLLAGFGERLSAYLETPVLSVREPELINAMGLGAMLTDSSRLAWALGVK